jgi:hypothetical protein
MLLGGAPFGFVVIEGGGAFSFPDDSISVYFLFGNTVSFLPISGVNNK